MIEEGPEEPLLAHLAVCVTFFYVPERLSYLSTVISSYIGMANKTDVYIVTNIADTTPIEEALPQLPDNMAIKFVIPSNIGHPYFLTWTHRQVFLEVLASGKASHFLYSEDDLLFTRSNILFWLRYREPLQKHGLIPSFFRVELHPEKGWVSTDCTGPVQLHRQPMLTLEMGDQLICMPNPYQGMYFLDRQLMEEFAASPAMSPDFGIWPIREKAAQGLTFVNVPQGFTSRNLALVDPHANGIAQESWIHHLPNTYAHDDNSPFGKIPAQGNGLFQTRAPKRFPIRWKRRRLRGSH